MFVTVRLVVEALAIVPLVTEAVRAVRLVVEAVIAAKRELVALVNEALAVKRFVLVAFVTTEDVAKIFCEKRLRKRRVFVPRERVMSVVGRMSASRLSVL